MKIEVLASGSKANCTFVNSRETSLLLDCGLNFKETQRKLDFKTSSLSGVLITHEHGDHAVAARKFIKSGIDCYMSKETAENLNLSGHRVKILEPLKRFELGDWSILPFPTDHDVPSLGFLLADEEGNKILYLIDTPYCRYKFKGLTHILVGCNYSREIIQENSANGILHESLMRRIMRSHMSLETLIDFLKANDLSKVEEIHLLHLSSSNSDAELFRREVQKVTGKLVIVA